MQLRPCDFCGRQEGSERFVAFACAAFELVTWEVGDRLLLWCTCHRMPAPLPATASEVDRIDQAGHWLACPECAALVHAEEAEALTGRTFTALLPRDGAVIVSRQVMETSRRGMQQMFWLHRTA